jgi:3' terminal RNA ribose 2'-O-methyltransferase Hen1
MDVSYHELLKAKEKLYFDEMSPRQKERIQLFQSSLTYRDKRLKGYDAVALVEVIEHIDLSRLPSFERVLFEFAKPKTIVLSTPNKEYNSIWEKMNPNSFRHDDHRFEWNREEFLTWVTKVAKKYNYEFEIQSIGDDIEPLGSPTQVAVFTHKG